MKKNIFFVVILVLVFISSLLQAQAELVPVSHKVYIFLNSLHKKGIIENYNNANLPLSRRAVADYLEIIDKSRDKLTNTEKDILADLQVEFSY